MTRNPNVELSDLLLPFSPGMNVSWFLLSAPLRALIPLPTALNVLY